jgi:hypothetical protein
VYCTSTGLLYSTSTDKGEHWIYATAPLSGENNERVEYPSIASGNDYAILTYDYGTKEGIFSRIFQGNEWSEEIYSSEGVGTLNPDYALEK